MKTLFKSGPVTTAAKSLEIPASLAELSRARGAVEDAAKGFGFPEPTRFQIKVAVSEAITNAIIHGSPHGERDRIRIECCEEDGDFAVYVRDAGVFSERSHTRDEFAERGRGLRFMGTLMDDVDIQLGADGTSVRLLKRRDF